MPRGIPVATVAIDNAVNAGLLACRILGAQNINIRNKMKRFMLKQEEEITNKAEKIETIGYSNYLDELLKK